MDWGFAGNLELRKDDVGGWDVDCVSVMGLKDCFCQ
jgi:hypothetical protein